MIQEEIILEAQNQIREGDRSLKEIANYLGFKDSAHFNHFFKKHLGQCPSFFVNQSMQDEEV